MADPGDARQQAAGERTANSGDDRSAVVSGAVDQWGKPLDLAALRDVLEAAPPGSDWWFDGRDLFYKPEGTNLDQVIVPLPETWHESQQVPQAVGVLVATSVNFLRASLASATATARQSPQDSELSVGLLLVRVQEADEEVATAWRAVQQTNAEVDGLRLGVQEAERALRKVAKFKASDPMLAALQVARTYFGVGGDVQEQETTTDLGDGAAVSSGGDS